MNDDFFGKRVERKKADPVYDAEGFRPHPDKPGWSIDRQGRLRGPIDGHVQKQKESTVETYVPNYPF